MRMPFSAYHKWPASSERHRPLAASPDSSWAPYRGCGWCIGPRLGCKPEQRRSANEAKTNKHQKRKEIYTANVYDLLRLTKAHYAITKAIHMHILKQRPSNFDVMPHVGPFIHKSTKTRVLCNLCCLCFSSWLGTRTTDHRL